MKVRTLLVAKYLLLVLGFLMGGSVFAAQDPTAPLGWQAPTQKSRTQKVYKPVLQSVLCDEYSRCSAIINGRNVSVGQSVSGYRVIKIYPDSVVVSRGGKQSRLALFADNITIKY